MEIAQLGKEDLSAAAELVLKVFDEYVAKDYQPSGRDAFWGFAGQQAMEKRLAEGTSFLLGAKDKGQLAGVIEFRDNCHVCLLFVDGKYHGKGIAGMLMEAGITCCRKNWPAVQAITVNSSPYACVAYQKMGFILVDGEAEKDGIRYFPMKRVLGKSL